MEAGQARRILRSAADVPVALIDELVDDMVVRLDGTAEARQCAGLSFSYIVTGGRLPTYRYEVAGEGRLTLAREDPRPSTFTFTGDEQTFDSVLRGHTNALKALITGRIGLRGSLWDIRTLLRMMPAVERAYTQARSEMIGRHRERYDFRF